MKKTIIAAAALAASMSVSAGPADLRWIDKTPTYNIGQSWGVPFKKGEVKDNSTFNLTDAQGNIIPSQSWVMARYTDGSAKWVGISATLTPDHKEGLRVNAVAPVKKQSRKKSAPVAATLVKAATDSELVIDNGVFTMTFPTSGANILSSIEMDGRTVAGNGRLVLQTEDRSKAGSVSYNDFQSKVTSAIVERGGEVAAVVKVEGMYQALEGSRQWLPFTVRFYIHKDAVPVKVVYSFVFDGDNHKDFIKGMGMEFSLPFREEIQNRHVAFAGQNDGLWDEAVEPLLGGMMVPGQRINVQEEQFNNRRVPNFADCPENFQRNLTNWAKYNDYKLVQPNPDGFTIQKRTGEHSLWFGTAGGNRARGYIAAGDVTGGLGVSLKNFWQSYPAELHASDMLTDNGKLTVWMWSPSAEAMDMRHYDIQGHDLGSSYEDWVEGYDTPYGIAHTSELYLFPFSQMPSREEMSDMADIGQDILQLVATPETLHEAGAFGIWSLQTKDGNDTRAYLEKQIDKYLRYYETNIEAQRWYGFWNYGDFMHSYSLPRHTWNYDHGGRAWDNTELETDIWLWFGFIRSGRPDFWRVATAMTRHTSEVDAYHIGRMKGLGTRHNVTHWGCGAKEARVGQAWWKRYYYYLTTDDRLGDLMHESINADEAIIEFDPLIRAQGRDKFPTSKPTRLRWGPDWTALIGNWFTEYERTGETKWLDKINAGMNSLVGLPNGLFTGQGPYGYDPATGVLTYEGDPSLITNRNHLANLQGSVEVLVELLDEVDNKAFTDTWVEYASWYPVPADDPIRNLPENARFKNWYGHWNIPRLLAIAATRLNNDYLAQLAWKRFLEGTIDLEGKTIDRVDLNPVGGSDALNPSVEDVRVGTNDCAQWNLEAIVMMELLGNTIPDLKDIPRARSTARAR